MTKLERQLADTFKAARWAESQGRSICPSCYDHRSVGADRPPRSGQPGLDTYYCRDCGTRFSDISGTVLSRSFVPLRVWAIALLMDQQTHDWRFLGSATGIAPVRLRTIWAKWQQGSRLAPAWTKALADAGLTFDHLLNTDRHTTRSAGKERSYAHR